MLENGITREDLSGEGFGIAQKLRTDMMQRTMPHNIPPV